MSERVRSIAEAEEIINAKRAARRNGKPTTRRRRTTSEPTPAATADATPLDQLRGRLGQLDRAGRLSALIDSTYRNGDGGASYGLVLAGRDVDLGPAGKLLKPRDVQAAILDAAGIAIAVPRLDDWAAIAELIVAAAELRDVTLSPAEETGEWLSHYLRLQGQLPAVHVADAGQLYAVIGGTDPQPFTDQDGRLYLRLLGLLRHVTVIIGQRTTARDLSERLGALGFTKRQLSARHVDSDGVAKLRVWTSRPNFDPHA
jgi:hypothetical protein